MGRLRRGVGAVILRAAPALMKFLSVAGTAAMFMVGGGILAHGIPGTEHWFEALAGRARGLSGLGDVFAFILPTLLHMLLGVLVGSLAVAGVTLGKRLRRTP